MKEANNLLINIGRRVTDCRSSHDAQQLIQSMENFLRDTKPQQEARFERMTQLVVDLYGKCSSFCVACEA